MMVLKRKQIVALSLVVMIIAAGYLQYSYNQSSASQNQNGRLGDAVFVDMESDDIDENDDYYVSASSQTNNYFVQAKLDREITRSRDSEAFKDIVEDTNASESIKESAYEKMISIISNSENESRIEALIKEKGFNDVLALFGDDGSIDIIVKTPSLTSAQVAQIADIVTRHANVEMTQVFVKNMY